MGCKIITISREFGSGGRSIGKQLAERLNLDYYDKEIVQQAAAESGFNESFIEDQGEFAPSKSRFAYAFPGPGIPGVMKGMNTTDYLWCVQRDIILQLAEKGPCVIVGRCADHILKDRTDCLHVFIHAELAFRAERIVRLYGTTGKSPEQRLLDKDRRRRVNYKHFTSRDWGMSQNYHLSLDSGFLGVERCVDLIAEIARVSGLLLAQK